MRRLTISGGASVLCGREGPACQQEGHAGEKAYQAQQSTPCQACRVFHGLSLSQELELLLQELEKALGISPDLATTQMELAAQDAQAEMLHQYDVHGRHLVTGGSVELNLAAAYRPTAEHRAAPTASLQQLATVMPMSPDTSLYSQPAGKKQKKAGSTMGPPHTTQRGVATVSKASGANSGGTSKLKTKSAPSTPQGLASQVLLPQTRLGPVLGISPASFHQVMQRGLQPEMESYMA
ncbi:hypothetical protein QJQ45_020978, partial [Haematococcus lacustris]